jgi:beta-galactosidase
MKHHGFNAIRTSHNPPSTAFLDACDRLGVVVIDEFFDQWERQKNPDDYHLSFNDWWKRDVESIIFRDRNHPSVILWSIGNEIGEHRTTRGVEIEKQLSDWVRQLDSTRPLTASVNGLGGLRFEPAFHTLDVAGANYMAAPNQWDVYKEHEIQPKRVIAGTEAFPRLAYEGWQLVMKNPWIIGDFTWTGMDHLGESAIGYPSLVPIPRGGGAGAGGPALGGPVAGSGGAAAGGPAPGGGGGGLSQAGFPWFNNFSGDVDLIGQAKPQLYFKHVVWGTSKLEMAVQRPLPAGMNENVSLWGWSDELRSWTWPGYEGHPIKVRVYSSADQVQLLLNGKEIATKQVPKTNDIGCHTESDCANSSALRVEFEVPYSAGELKAVALSGGSQIAELSFRTVGKPAKLRLTPDRDTIRFNRSDLSYVTVWVLDEKGNEIPDASLPVGLSVTGAGELAGSGTANPKDVYSFRNATPTTFHGKAMAIIRPNGVAGAVTLRASCLGLEGASVTIKFA